MNDYINAIAINSPLQRSSSQTLEVFQRAVWLVEDERQSVLTVLDTLTDERPQIILVRNLERHFSSRPCHLELEIFAGVLRSLRQVEGDAAQRKLEADLLIYHSARAEDWQ